MAKGGRINRNMHVPEYVALVQLRTTTGFVLGKYPGVDLK